MLLSFLSLLFPEVCAMCHNSLIKGETEICLHCQNKLAKTKDHLYANNLLAERFWGKVKIKHPMAYLKFVKNGSTQKLLHSIKYGHRKEAAEIIGQWYGYDIHAAGLSFDMIVPVPLHENKLAQRGYNQSSHFGIGLSRAIKSPFQEVLVRVHAKQSQTNKGRFERWKNVDGIFQLKHNTDILDKHVLLVDDVITTGATLEACAHVLLSGGAREVSIAAIASAQ